MDWFFFVYSGHGCSKQMDNYVISSDNKAISLS